MSRVRRIRQRPQVPSRKIRENNLMVEPSPIRVVRENNLAVQPSPIVQRPVSRSTPTPSSTDSRADRLLSLIDEYNKEPFDEKKLSSDMNKVKRITGVRNVGSKFTKLLVQILEEASKQDMLRIWKKKEAIHNIYSQLYDKQETIGHHYKKLNAVMKKRESKLKDRITMFLLDKSDKTVIDLKQADALQYRRDNPMRVAYDDIIRLLHVLEKKNDTLSCLMYVMLCTATRLAEVLHASKFSKENGKLRQEGIAKKGGEGRIIYDRMFYFATIDTLLEKIKIVQDEVLSKYPMKKKDRGEAITNAYSKRFNPFVVKTFEENNVIITNQSNSNTLTGKTMRTIAGNMLYVAKNQTGSLTSFLSKALGHQDRQSAQSYEEVQIVRQHTPVVKEEYKVNKKLQEQVETNKKNLNELLKDKHDKEEAEEGKKSLADLLQQPELINNDTRRSAEAKAQRAQKLKILMRTLVENGHKTTDKTLRSFGYGSVMIRLVKSQM